MWDTKRVAWEGERERESKKGQEGQSLCVTSKLLQNDLTRERERNGQK